MSTDSNGGTERRPLCAVCGEVIDSHQMAVCMDHPELSVPTAEKGNWCHAPWCKERFWDAPGEFAEWDTEVYG